MKRICSICIFAFILLAAVNISAEIRRAEFSMSPFFGGYTFEGDQNLRNKSVYGLRIGNNITEHWGFELVGNYVSTQTKDTEKSVKAYAYRTDLLYHFNPEGELVPFLAAGIGATKLVYSGTNNNSKGAVFSYGGGLQYFLTNSLALRADVRHNLYDVIHKHMDNLEYTAGLIYYFGGGTGQQSVYAPPSAPEIIVRETPAPEPQHSAKVEPTYEPLPIVIPEPKPAPVYEAKVMPKEQAPVEQPMEKAVSSKKAERVEIERIELRVLFDTAKSNVKAKYLPEIKKAADYLKKHPEVKAEIEGHTDNRGSAKGNLKLSGARAESVKKVLVKKFGIAAARLTAKGFGSARPLAENNTEAGRQKNRRVIAVFFAKNYSL